MQYRFGVPGKLELIYPLTKVATQDQFYWRELHPYQSFVHELIFKSGEYYYTVSTYNVSEELNDIPGGAHFGQIEVGKQWGSSQGKPRKCASYPKDSLWSLGGILKDGDDLLPK